MSEDLYPKVAESFVHWSRAGFRARDLADLASEIAEGCHRRADAIDRLRRVDDPSLARDLAEDARQAMKLFLAEMRATAEADAEATRQKEQSPGGQA